MGKQLGVELFHHQGRRRHGDGVAHRHHHLHSGGHEATAETGFGILDWGFWILDRLRPRLGGVGVGLCLCPRLGGGGVGLPVFPPHLLRRLAGIQNTNRNPLGRQQCRQFLCLHWVGLALGVALKKQKRFLPGVGFYL